MIAFRRTEHIRTSIVAIGAALSRETYGLMGDRPSLVPIIGHCEIEPRAEGRCFSIIGSGRVVLTLFGFLPYRSACFWMLKEICVGMMFEND